MDTSDMRPGDVLSLQGTGSSVLFIHDRMQYEELGIKKLWIIRGLDPDEAFMCLVVAVVPARSITMRADLISFSRWAPDFSHDGQIVLLHVTNINHKRLGVHAPASDYFKRFTGAPFALLLNNNTRPGSRGPLVSRLT